MVAAILSASFFLFGEEVDIKGNFSFSSRVKSMTPDDWGLAMAGQKEAPTEVEILPRDSNGVSTLHLKTHPKTAQIFFFFQRKIQAEPGDELSFSGEAKGDAKIFLSCSGYDVNNRNLGEANTSRIPLSTDFKAFTVKFRLEDLSRGKIRSIVPAFVIKGGPSEIYLKNLRLDIKRNPISFPVGFTEFRGYCVGKLSSTPSMNIELDLKNVWGTVPVAKGFFLLENTQFEGEERQTSIQMGHDGKNFYVLTRCEEPEMHALVTDSTSYHDGLAADDQVEFAVTYDRNVFQRYFVSNSAGACFQLHSSLDVKASGFRGQNHWYTCLSVPLKSLLPENKELEFGKNYYFNVGRSRYAGGAAIHSSYAKGFGDKQRFGILVFSEKTADAGAGKMAETLNEQYDSHIRLNIDKIKAENEECLKKLYGEYGSLTQEILKRLLALASKAKESENVAEMRDILRQRQKFDAALKKDALKKICFRIDNPKAVIHFYVNGNPVVPSKDGAIQCEIKEGVNIIAFQSKPAEKINVTLDEHPETIGQWRSGGGADKIPDWKNETFNDEKWDVVRADENGSFECKGYARQILLWNRTIHGPHRILPMTKSWRISENSIDSMRFASYSPLPFALKEYKIEFSMPEQLSVIKMLEFEKTPPNMRISKVNRPPRSVTEAKDPLRKNYHRYIFEFDDTTAEARGTTYTFMPLELKDITAGSKFNFYYTRKANGNFVELIQTVPFTVLPPVNGRHTRIVKFISDAVPLENIPAEFFDKKMTQHVKAGLNMWIWGGGEGKNSCSQDTFSRVEKTYGLGAKAEISTCLYPIWGCDNLKDGALFKYIVSTPGAKARFFNDEGQWDKLSDARVKKWKNISKFNRMYCPTFMLADGHDGFIRAVKEDFRDYWINSNPFSDGIFLNWENQVWDEKIQDDYCFCDRCKRAFKKFASIDDSVDLTDDRIKKHYRNEWFKFRSQLDGKILGLVATAARELNKHLYIYSQTWQEDYWRGASHVIDIPSPGLPGNAPADSKMQHFLDSSMKAFRENTGAEFVIGQQMCPAWGSNPSKNGYLKEFLASNTGFLDPESFKARTVRSIASLHGGTSWWGTYVFNNGMHYYIGEATRLIYEYEALFLYGIRDESLVVSNDIAYPNVLVLKRDCVPLKNPETHEYPVKAGRILNGSERLLLLFNESEQPKIVEIKNTRLSPNSYASVWESGKQVKNPSSMKLTVPPNDLLAVHVMEFQE
jgi:hypothetical protein